MDLNGPSPYHVRAADQLVITPPGSAPGTIYRGLPYPSPYGAGGSSPYGYPPPFPIGAPGFVPNDYSQRPLPPAPQGQYFPTVPPPASQFYPPTSVAPYRTPLRRASSVVSFDTFAPSEPQHHEPRAQDDRYPSRHHHRHHHNDVGRADPYEDDRYQSQSGGEYDSSDRHRHRSHKKRDKKHRHRRERNDVEAYHGGYYAPEAGYESRQ